MLTYENYIRTTISNCVVLINLLSVGGFLYSGTLGLIFLVSNLMKALLLLVHT